MIKVAMCCFIFLFSCIPASVSAITIDEIEAKLLEITQKVQSLQSTTSVVDIVSASVAGNEENDTAAFCVDIQNDLQVNAQDADTNGEVTLLQMFLQRNNYLKHKPTGFFARLTLDAVKRFQQDANLPVTGYVGRLTRAEMKNLLCAISNKQNLSALGKITLPSSTLQVAATALFASTQPSSVPTKKLPTLGKESPLMDFLIQDVCVDGSDNPIMGDPATCAKHRDLKFGEFLPYIRTNMPDFTGKAIVVSNAYPVEANDGSLLIMKTRDSGNFQDPAGLKNYVFRDLDSNSNSPQLVEAFDLIEGNGDYASTISTQDTIFQYFWRPGCAHDDTWLLFPMNPGIATSGIIEGRMTIYPTCSTTGFLPDGQRYYFQKGVTYWKHPSTPFTYSGYIQMVPGMMGMVTPVKIPGKSLDTIITYGILVKNEQNEYLEESHIELSYFTREYGHTRWEAWYPGKNPIMASLGDIMPGCDVSNYPIEGRTFPGAGNQLFYLKSCADWSFASSTDVAYNPLTNPGGQNLVFSKNLLSASDFAGSNIGTWQQRKINGLGTDWVIQGGPTENKYLSFACWGGCNNGGKGIYQDIDTTSSTGIHSFSFGASLKASKATHMAIGLSFYDANNLLVSQALIPAELDGRDAWKKFEGKYRWNFYAQPIKKITYQIYIADKTVLYSIDDAFLNRDNIIYNVGDNPTKIEKFGNLLEAGSFTGPSIGTWRQKVGTDWQIIPSPNTSPTAAHLVFACWGGCADGDTGLGIFGNGVFQEIDVSQLAGVKTMRFGAIMKSSKDSRVVIGLSYYDKDGVRVKQTLVPSELKGGNSWKHVDGTSAWNFGDSNENNIKSIRFSVFMADPTTLYSIDEAYVTPSI